MGELQFTRDGVWENGHLYVNRRAGGYVDGAHFTTYVEEVKRLKRIGELSAAEALLLRLVHANEAEAREMDWGVAPWYYEQLAIIYRKQKDPGKELAILERYAGQLQAPGGSPPKLAARLEKLRSILRSGP